MHTELAASVPLELQPSVQVVVGVSSFSTGSIHLLSSVFIEQRLHTPTQGVVGRVRALARARDAVVNENLATISKQLLPPREQQGKKHLVVAEKLSSVELIGSRGER